MTLIPSSTPPAQAHTVSAPAKSLPAGTSPGRLDIGLIENRLFGGTGAAPRHAVAKPTRDIGSTLSQFRPAAASVTPLHPRVTQHIEAAKRVQFVEHPAVETVDGSPFATAARMRLNPEALKDLSASQCLTEHGDSLRASTIKRQLLMCLSLNRDEALVSEDSEAVLRKAFLRADTLPGKVTCGPGDYCYDVLGAFLAVVEQKRPALLSAS